ncbi:MAG: YbaB/EbfC family nucleoid-associated protein [Dehalococcoidia bacterium]
MMNKGMLRQAQQMQAKLAKAQEELENTTVEASSGGGAVTVVVNGHQSIQSIKIAAEVVDPADVEMLEDLVMTAVNEAMDKAKELAASQLQAVTGGLKIPGLT